MVLGVENLAAKVPGLRPGAMVLQMALCILAATTLHAGTHLVQRSRNAVAEVSRDGDGFVVAVEFAPVKSLGAAKDAEVNRKLARDYALRGLARELGGTDATNLAVSGLRPEFSRLEEGHWKAVFRAASAEVENSQQRAPAAEADKVEPHLAAEGEAAAIDAEAEPKDPASEPKVSTVKPETFAEESDDVAKEPEATDEMPEATGEDAAYSHITSSRPLPSSIPSTLDKIRSPLPLQSQPLSSAIGSPVSKLKHDWRRTRSKFK